MQNEKLKKKTWSEKRADKEETYSTEFENYNFKLK